MTRPSVTRSKLRHFKCSAVVVVRASGAEVVITHDDPTEMARMASTTPSEPGDTWFYVTSRGYRKPWPPEQPKAGAEAPPAYSAEAPPVPERSPANGQFVPPAGSASGAAAAPASGAAPARWVANEESLQNVVRMIGHIYADAFEVAHKNVRVTLDAMGNALVSLSNRVAVLSERSDDTEKELSKLRAKIGNGEASNDDLAQLTGLLQTALANAP